MFVLVGVVLLNIIANVLTNKFPALTADLTSLRSFELSEKSKEIAGQVSKLPFGGSLAQAFRHNSDCVHAHAFHPFSEAMMRL